MADIIHEFTVKAQPVQVFQAFATPAGLEKWWTKTSTGDSHEGGTIRLFFGPEFDWEAIALIVTPSGQLLKTSVGLLHRGIAP